MAKTKQIKLIIKNIFFDFVNNKKNSWMQILKKKILKFPDTFKKKLSKQTNINPVIVIIFNYFYFL